jgi:hypothetical protein
MLRGILLSLLVVSGCGSSPSNKCLSPCPAPQVCCNGSCVETQTDDYHCGACGNVCSVATICANGVCSCVCSAGQMCCGTPPTCTNLQTDNNNCGVCGVVCPSGQICVSGTCT